MYCLYQGLTHDAVNAFLDGDVGFGFDVLEHIIEGDCAAERLIEAGVHAMPVVDDAELVEMVDKIMDDGNLNTGNVRLGAEIKLRYFNLWNVFQTGAFADDHEQRDQIAAIARHAGLYPQAGFDGRVRISPGTQRPRMSTGVELQVMLPVVNAPFRLYWAYNPMIVQDFLQAPVVADRSFFPNQATFINSVAMIGQPMPFFERRKTFRFTISRTF